MRRYIKRLLLLVFGTLALIAIFLGIEQWRGNFHTVIPGELYRSAQLMPGDVTRYQKAYGIRSVLNLRGMNINEPWYEDEVNEARAVGVSHLDYRMSSGRELTLTQVKGLISLMQDAPKPMLIHCRAGADRTGLAAAFYLAAIAKSSEMAAERQLWIYYGHLPFWINESFAMNRTFERMEPYLGFPDS